MSENRFTELVDEARHYADLRVDELKLRATSGLSLALGQLLAMLLIVAVLAITLGLLAFAMLQWLNGLMGAPWGTLTVFALYAVALAVLVTFRKKLFRNMFVKLFIDAFYDQEEVDNE